MVLENHFAGDRDDVGGVHSHRSECEDGVDSDDRRKDEKSHEG